MQITCRISIDVISEILVVYLFINFSFEIRLTPPKNPLDHNLTNGDWYCSNRFFLQSQCTMSCENNFLLYSTIVEETEENMKLIENSSIVKVCIADLDENSESIAESSGESSGEGIVAINGNSNYGRIRLTYKVITYKINHLVNLL